MIIMDCLRFYKLFLQCFCCISFDTNERDDNGDDMYRFPPSLQKSLVDSTSLPHNHHIVIVQPDACDAKIDKRTYDLTERKVSNYFG